MHFSSKFVAKCVLPVLMLGLLPGCSTITDSSAWKKTSSFYYTYLNRPVELDLNAAESLPAGESRLASRFMPLDWQLIELEHAVAAVGNMPDQYTADEMMRTFPWLSGVVFLDRDASVFASVPSIQLKQLDYTPLLEVASHRSPRALRACAQDTPLGPEILLARPIMQEDEVAGYFVVSFDFRSLLPYAGTADDIVARAGDVVLWSGNRMYEETPLAGEDWDKNLRRASFGKVGRDGDEMVWIVRYLGGMPLVVAGPDVRS